MRLKNIIIALKRKSEILYDDYYTNFITFLKNSFEYERCGDKDLNIVDYINNFKI